MWGSGKVLLHNIRITAWTAAPENALSGLTARQKRAAEKNMEKDKRMVCRLV